MDQFEIAKQFFSQNQIAYLADEPLMKYTSFKIGGKGKIVVFPSQEEQVKKIFAYCHERKIPCLILGNGSNVLISDQGYDGVVLVLGRDFSEISLLDEETILATAGASLMKVCRFAQQHGLSGLEFAYGIPATVGGAVYMNAGAYGGEMKDVLLYANHIQSDGTVGRFTGEELDLSYRHSVYSQGGYCVLSAAFRLKKGDREEIQQKMDDFLNRRREKQPLEYPSAGSTFKRPEGAYAAKLIEDCGLKGVKVGGAQVSEKHSGFLINADHATCEDVLALIRLVQQKVKEQTGFTLECEVRRIGSGMEDHK